MKTNKKAILSAAAVLGVAGLVAGGTIAYFTDKTDPITNQFTVGDIEVELYESQLHRMNSGRQGSFAARDDDDTYEKHYCDWEANTDDSGLDSNTSLIKGSYSNAKYCTPGINANEGNSSTITAIANGHVGGIRTWGYKDETIENDDYAAYFADVAQNIVPGQYVRKFSYAKNTGNNDAYVLIRYMIPKAYAADLEVKVPHTPYGDSGDDNRAYFTAVAKNATSGAYEATTYGTSYEDTIDNVEYVIYAAVTTEALNPGEMTYWSPVNTIKIKDTITETQVAPATEINVKVDAQAIQSRTFSDAIEAINNL